MQALSARRGRSRACPAFVRLLALQVALSLVAFCLSGCGKKQEKGLRPPPASAAPEGNGTEARDRPPNGTAGGGQTQTLTSTPTSTLTSTSQTLTSTATSTTTTNTSTTTSETSTSTATSTSTTPTSTLTSTLTRTPTSTATSTSTPQTTTTSRTVTRTSTSTLTTTLPVNAYKLDWQAHGSSFFDGFKFLSTDHNHGASAFAASYEEAKREGVVEAWGSHAILRAGKESQTYPLKRNTAKIETTRKWKYFLAAMRFTHVPYGCGVWPAFFTLAPDLPWPQGGELDVLEYVNNGGSMTSFHTSKQCILNAEEVNRYKPMPDQNLVSNNYSNYNCLTKYCDTCTSLGCAPNALPLRSAKEWAHTPGVIAVERTESFVKVFSLPDWGWSGNLPPDLNADAPQPDKWDKYLISYYPFGKSPLCPDAANIMAPQSFILSIAFCGDWASKVWGQSGGCDAVGPSYNETATIDKLPIPVGEDNKRSQCRAVDPLAEYAPKQDCCTQFIADEDRLFGTNKYLHERAFFNITWFKVYT